MAKKKSRSTSAKIEKQREAIDGLFLLNRMAIEKVDSELMNVPEPKHINYFFWLNGIPGGVVHLFEEIEDYLIRFSDYGFSEELKLDFLNYISKTYKNFLVSLESIDLSRLLNYNGTITKEVIEGFALDDFSAENLHTHFYFANCIEENNKGKKSNDEIQKMKNDFINNGVDNSIKLIKRLLKLIENEIEYEKGRKPNESQGARQVDLTEKIIEIESDKLIWKGTKQDLVALYDELIELDLIIPDKNKDQKLGEHFRILNKKNKQLEDVGELKHTRRQLKDGWAKPTDKTEELLKKIQELKVDNK